MRRTAIGFLPALAVVGCVSGGSEGGAGLYEDDPNAEVEGKADGNGLSTLHLVEGYRPLLEPRVVDSAVATDDFLAEGSLEPGAAVVLIRSLSLDGVPTVVGVDDATFELFLASSEAFDAASRPATADEQASFRYLAALEETRNAVLCRLRDRPRGAPLSFTVTVDMCQSRREWEGDFYTWLVELGQRTGEPQPVGVAMTGLWAHRHADDFRQLVSWQRAGLLDVRWINHSYHHQLSRDADGVYHFLTAQSVNLTSEALELEELLLQQGALFSVLFRFPGLTHDRRTLAELNDLGLFPIDANGWLAKGEPIEDDSVVLLHGNGNEPEGIRMFFDWARPREQEIEAGAVALTDPLEALPAVHGDAGGGILDGFSPCAP